MKYIRELSSYGGSSFQLKCAGEDCLLQIQCVMNITAICYPLPNLWRNSQIKDVILYRHFAYNSDKELNIHPTCGIMLDV